MKITELYGDQAALYLSSDEKDKTIYMIRFVRFSVDRKVIELNMNGYTKWCLTDEVDTKFVYIDTVPGRIDC